MRSNDFFAGIAVASLLIYGAVLFAQNASIYRAEGNLPSVVSIRASMPDTARVCVEPPSGGLVACRSIGELRKWIVESKAK